MAKYIKELTLDVGHKNMLLMIPAKQYDYDSRFLRVQLTKDGVPFAVENTAMAVIVPTRPDCTTKAFSCEIEDDGRILVPLTYWTVELEGLVSAYISVVDANGRKISTLDFTIIVERSNYNGAEISPDEPQYDIIMQVIASENVRVANEEARISAEAERVNNEKTRVDNEKARVDNENVRIENEGARKALHEEMKTFFDGVENVLTNKNVAQELGDSEEKVLSQKAVTENVVDRKRSGVTFIGKYIQENVAANKIVNTGITVNANNVVVVKMPFRGWGALYNGTKWGAGTGLGEVYGNYKVYKSTEAGTIYFDTAIATAEQNIECYIFEVGENDLKDDATIIGGCLDSITETKLILDTMAENDTKILEAMAENDTKILEADKRKTNNIMPFVFSIYRGFIDYDIGNLRPFPEGYDNYGAINEYIPINGNSDITISLTTYKHKNDGAPINVVAWYDEYKKFISAEHSEAYDRYNLVFTSGKQYVTSPENAKYMRFGWFRETAVEATDIMAGYAQTYLPYEASSYLQADTPVQENDVANKKYVDDAKNERYRKSQNIMPEFYETARGFWRKESGVLGTVAGYDNYGVVKDYLPVNAGDNISINIKLGSDENAYKNVNIVAWYDENKTFLSYVGDYIGEGKVFNNTTLCITVPENAAYMRFGWYTNAEGVNATNIMVCVTDAPQTYQTPYVLQTGFPINESDVANKGYVDKMLGVGATKWQGKKWCAIGDSITIHTGNYVGIVANALGLIATNLGISGANANRMLQSFTNESHADYTAERKQAVIDADLITIYGFANDYYPNAPAIGDLYNSVSGTYTYNVKALIEAVLTLNPTAKIIIIGCHNIWDSYRPKIYQPVNGENNIADYIEMLDKIAKYYGLPFIDMYHDSGINEYSAPTFLADNCHPTDTGYARISEIIKQRLSIL